MKTESAFRSEMLRRSREVKPARRANTPKRVGADGAGTLRTVLQELRELHALIAARRPVAPGTSLRFVIEEYDGAGKIKSFRVEN